MQIATTINDIEFSNYPQSLVIDGIAGETVGVKAYISTSLILDVTLTASDSRATVEGFGSLITRYMEIAQATHATIKVELLTGSTISVTKEWIAIYQRDMLLHPVASWLQSHFLTIGKIRNILPAVESIYFFNDEDLEQTSQDANVTLRAYIINDDDSLTESTSTAGIIDEVVLSDASHDYMLYHFYVDMMAIAASANVSLDKIAAVAVEYKSRRMFYYRTDNYDIALRYLSSFGYEEVIGIPGTTEKKISDSRQTALVGGRLIAYDNLQSFDYEFESAWLSQAEIKRAVECMRSRSVSLIDGTPITISKIDTEISDEKGKAQRVKFTYRYADGTQPIAGGVHDDNIFSQQYDINFD